MDSSSGSEHPEQAVFHGKNGQSYKIEDMFKTVRELLQNDDLSADQLKEFMRSEMFLEVCPDLHEAFNSNEKNKKSFLGGGEDTPSQAATSVVKKEPEESSKKPPPPAPAEAHCSSAIKNEKTKIRLLSTSKDSSSDSEAAREKHHKRKKKKKHKKRHASSNSEASSTRHHTTKHVDKKKTQADVKNEPGTSKQQSSFLNPEKKVHPYFLSQVVFEPKGKVYENNTGGGDNNEKKKRKQEQDDSHRKKHNSAPPKVREPKPYSYYSRSYSKIGNGKNWRIKEENEFHRLQKRHKLKAVSILCVDLLKLESIFHNSSKGPVSSGDGETSTIPLKRHMNISDHKGDEIEKQEKAKSIKFKPVLNRIYARNLKYHQRVSRATSSDDDGRRRDNKKRTKRIDSSSDGSSYSPVPHKRSKGDNHKSSNINLNNYRKGSAEYKKAANLKNLENLRAKNEQKKVETRRLPWEDNEYFAKRKKDKEARDKAAAEKTNAKNNNRDPHKFIGRIPKKNEVTTSLQTILQQIAVANQEAASKPQVLLKIPKISERPYEYKPKPNEKDVSANSASGGGLVEEVSKLLRSKTKVEMPTMQTAITNLTEYTIRKIGWWFLKNEKDPADEVLYHPERLDHIIYEDWFDPDAPLEISGLEDDDESIGCVSDPEGLNRDYGEPNLDPDVIDEFCGLTSLQAKIRLKGADGKGDKMISFFRVRPGFNYEKPNFEAKCFICDERIGGKPEQSGQRLLGAHIRSDNHQLNFRNYSLKHADYEEKTTPVVQKKVFLARLVEYGVEARNTIDMDEKEKPQKEGADDKKSPDSPMAVLGDNNNSPDVVAIRDIPVDELSLPSIAVYDLEPDNEQLRCKIAIRTAGKWNDAMESKWKRMLEKEAKITNEYNDLRELYINEPEKHPLKDSEWVKFWDRRSMEIEAAGKDPDKHDYSTEWIPFWLKRMQELMKIEVECKMLNMKQDFKLDSGSLKIMMADLGIAEIAENMPLPKEYDEEQPLPNTGQERDQQWNNGDNPFLSEVLPLAANLDKNSLGYHLLLKTLPGTAPNLPNKFPRVVTPKSKPKNRYHGEVDLLEQRNPIGVIGKEAKSRRTSREDRHNREENSNHNPKHYKGGANYQDQQNPIGAIGKEGKSRRTSRDDRHNREENSNHNPNHYKGGANYHQHNSQNPKPQYYGGRAPGPKSRKSGWNYKNNQNDASPSMGSSNGNWDGGYNPLLPHPPPPPPPPPPVISQPYTQQRRLPPAPPPPNIGQIFIPHPLAPTPPNSGQRFTPYPPANGNTWVEQSWE